MGKRLARDPTKLFGNLVEINSPKIISGNHVSDFSGSPTEINSINKKAAGNIFGWGGGLL